LNKHDEASKIICSRSKLSHYHIDKEAAEGGCGVVGLASSIPIAGRYILKPLAQMHNRGNGKGGGVAAVGLSEEEMGISKKQLNKDYLLQIAYLDDSVRDEVEEKYIKPYLRMDDCVRVHTEEDYGRLGLEVKPPDIWRYFCRVKETVLDEFAETHSFDDKNSAEDEFIYQNSFRLNYEFYASLGEKKAFVLSHGKNMFVAKLVGYAEQLIKYYGFEDLTAHIWIGHQRYPTKGRVWHPGGAHPFIGMHEALVHNGDFSNYHSVCEYLRQRNIYPLFLTDTEVSVQLFDLWSRVYRYPLEYIIEAMAPTSERDFDMLPETRRNVYRAIQASHIHGSPDGPWFFIVGRNEPYKNRMELMGITDTSMLRPQVFALAEGKDGEKIGMIASEKQAIDATLKSLSSGDGRFYPRADKYWNARGGSHTDGGTFIFRWDDTRKELSCTDKFGRSVET